MTCARCTIPLKGRGKTSLCQRCSAKAPGRRFFAHTMGHGTQLAKARAGLRNIWTVLKGLP